MFKLYLLWEIIIYRVIRVQPDDSTPVSIYNHGMLNITLYQSIQILEQSIIKFIYIASIKKLQMTNSGFSVVISVILISFQNDFY